VDARSVMLSAIEVLRVHFVSSTIEVETPLPI